MNDQKPHNGLSTWLWAPSIALQFLTRIPVGRVPDWAYQEDGGRSFALHPLVGLVVGACAASVLLVLRGLGLPSAACAILTVSASIVLTGGMHEDGLADTADGLGPHKGSDGLRVMRDSRIGAYGSIALWILLSLKGVALYNLGSGTIWPALLAAHALSRWSALPMTALLPDARAATAENGSSGLGAAMIRAIHPTTVLVGSAITVAALWPILGPARLLTAVIAAIVIAALTGIFYKRRFGGITGDCLGATNQIVEVAVLLLLGRAHP